MYSAITILCWRASLLLVCGHFFSSEIGVYVQVLEGSAQYGIESDVFSYAMVLYELVTRQVPWGHITGEGAL